MKQRLCRSISDSTKGYSSEQWNSKGCAMNGTLRTVTIYPKIFYFNKLTFSSHRSNSGRVKNGKYSFRVYACFLLAHQATSSLCAHSFLNKTLPCGKKQVFVSAFFVIVSKEQHRTQDMRSGLSNYCCLLVAYENRKFDGQIKGSSKLTSCINL